MARFLSGIEDFGDGSEFVFKSGSPKEGERFITDFSDGVPVFATRNTQIRQRFISSLGQGGDEGAGPTFDFFERGQTPTFIPTFLTGDEGQQQIENIAAGKKGEADLTAFKEALSDFNAGIPNEDIILPTSDIGQGSVPSFTPPSQKDFQFARTLPLTEAYVNEAEASDFIITIEEPEPGRNLFSRILTGVQRGILPAAALILGGAAIGGGFAVGGTAAGVAEAALPAEFIGVGAGTAAPGGLGGITAVGTNVAANIGADLTGLAGFEGGLELTAAEITAAGGTPTVANIGADLAGVAGFEGGAPTTGGGINLAGEGLAAGGAGTDILSRVENVATQGLSTFQKLQIGAGLLGVGVNLITAKQASDAIENATQAQINAQMEALEVSQTQFETTRQDLQEALDLGIIDITQANDLASDFLTKGFAQAREDIGGGFGGAIEELRPLTSLDALKQARGFLEDPSQIFDLPGVEFQFETGERALENILSKTTGGAVSGDILKAATEFGQNFASTQLDTALNRLFPFINLDVGARTNIANLFRGEGIATGDVTREEAIRQAGLAEQGGINLANLRAGTAGRNVNLAGSFLPLIAGGISDIGVTQAGGILGKAQVGQDLATQISKGVTGTVENVALLDLINRGVIRPEDRELFIGRTP